MEGGTLEAYEQPDAVAVTSQESELPPSLYKPLS